MTNRERNVLILVLAILAACGLVALVSPSPAEPGVPAAPEGTQPSAAFTFVPTTTSTLAPANPPTPTRTHTSSLTPTALPTAALTNTPLPAETPVPRKTPQLTTPPEPASPLAMDWMLVQKGCVSDAQWMVEFWITAKGGTGEYTFYLDDERLHGPAEVQGFAYQMYALTGNAAEGTFIVESGPQRVRSEFWVERLDCGDPAPSPTPDAPPTTGAMVSPLDPGSSP